MITGLDKQLVAHDGSCLRGRACRRATATAWCDQFRRAFAIQVVLCKHLHPSKHKRKRLSKRPEAALTFKVSTILTDMRKIDRQIRLIKGIVAVLAIQMRFRERRMGGVRVE